MHKLFWPHRTCCYGFGICFVEGQFPYLVIWLPSVFGRGDVDAMTMLMMTQVCRSTASTTLSITSRILVLPTLSFELSSLHMELILYTLASLASAAIWFGVIPGDIHMELTLYIFSLSPAVLSHGINMDPKATRFGN